MVASSFRIVEFGNYGFRLSIDDSVLTSLNPDDCDYDLGPYVPPGMRSGCGAIFEDNRYVGGRKLPRLPWVSAPPLRDAAHGPSPLVDRQQIDNSCHLPSLLG